MFCACQQQKFLKESDSNKSGDVALNEFINYVREHEKNLQLQFSHLDRNKDGEFDFRYVSSLTNHEDSPNIESIIYYPCRVCGLRGIDSSI